MSRIYALSRAKKGAQISLLLLGSLNKTYLSAQQSKSNEPIRFIDYLPNRENFDDPKTIDLINVFTGTDPAKLKMLYCPDLAKNAATPPAFGIGESKDSVEHSKKLVDYMWHNSLMWLLENGKSSAIHMPRQFRQAPQHQAKEGLRNGSVEDIIVPQGEDAWKKRTLARALLSPQDLSILFSTTQGGKQLPFGDNISFVALLPDDIFYPFIARKITQRMNTQLPVPNALEGILRTKHLPVNPTDSLQVFMPSSNPPLYTASTQSAWIRVLEIAKKLQPASKGPKVNPTEAAILCEEFVSLMAQIQEAKVKQLTHDIAKQNIHDSTPQSMKPKVDPFSQFTDPLSLFSHAGKNQLHQRTKDRGPPRLSVSDGEEAGECFNDAYYSIVDQRAKDLAKDPRFSLYFANGSQKKLDLFLRVAEQSRQGQHLQQFLLQMRASATDFTPEEAASEEKTVQRLTRTPFTVEELNFDPLAVADPVKEMAQNASSILAEDHAGTLLLFLNDYLPVLAKKSGKATPDQPIALLNGSFNRFMNDKSKDGINNHLYMQALYTALREEIPQAGILESDTAFEIQNKIQRLHSEGIQYNFSNVYSKLTSILSTYQPTANSQNTTSPQFPGVNANEQQQHINNLKVLRAYMLSSDNALRTRIKKCAELIAQRKGVDSNPLYESLLEELNARYHANNEIRKQKVVGKIELSPEEMFTNLLTTVPLAAEGETPSLSAHLHNLRANQLQKDNLEEAGKYYRETYDVKALPLEQQHHGILDMSKVPLLGKEAGSNTTNPDFQKEVLNFLDLEHFQHLVALYGVEEAGNLCRMYFPLLNPSNQTLVNQDVKQICDKTSDALGVTAPHRFRTGNQIIIPNSYNPESEKTSHELKALKKELAATKGTQLRGRQSRDAHEKFIASKEAKIKKLTAQIEAKTRQYENELMSASTTRAPRILSVDEFNKEVEGFEVKARDLFKKYAKELEDLDMFSGGQRDFWVNMFKNTYVSVMAVPLLAATGVVGEGPAAWKALKDAYKIDSKVMPKFLEIHERLVNDLLHMRQNVESRLGLVQRFTQHNGQTALLPDPERDRVFAYIDATQSLFETGKVKDEHGEDTKKTYGPFADYEKGTKAAATELAITAGTFGIGTAWNLGLRGATRVLSYGTRGTLAGRGFAHSFSRASRFINPTRTAGKVFMGRTLQRGLTQSTQVAVMNSAFPRTLPYLLEHTPVGVQKVIYGAEIQKGGKHSRDYMMGMMEDPWFKFKTDTVYQLFTPFYVSAEARMNAAMMKGYSKTMSAAERSQNVLAQGLTRAGAQVPTRAPVIAATTASNALSGIPVDVYVQYFDPITGTRERHKKEVAEMQKNIKAIKDQIKSGTLSPIALQDQEEKLKEAEKGYLQKLEEPFNQVRSGAVMGAGMAWGMVGVGDPYEKVGIMMKYQRSMTPEQARSLLKIDQNAEIGTVTDLWERTDQRMVEIWDNGRMFIPDKDAAGSFEKMLQAMAAYNVLKRSASGL